MGFERGASGNGASRVFACALDADDALWCWGAGVGNLKTPQAQQPGSRFSAAWVGPGSNGGTLVGVSPLVGRDEDGKFFVWGKNNRGLISSSNVNAFIENPLPLYEDETVRSAVLGFSHLCALVGDEDPVVRCRGDNAQGQTGNTEITGLDDGTDLDTPAFVSVFAGLSFSCGLTAEGIAHCWGTRTVGQTRQRDGVGDGFSYSHRRQRRPSLHFTLPGLKRRVRVDRRPGDLLLGKRPERQARQRRRRERDEVEACSRGRHRTLNPKAPRNGACAFTSRTCAPCDLIGVNRAFRPSC